MRISNQGKTRILRLIDEGYSLDHCDAGAFHLWSQASYDALKFDSVQQQRFDEYCRSSAGLTAGVRRNVGVRILEQVICKAASEGLSSMWTTAHIGLEHSKQSIR